MNITVSDAVLASLVFTIGALALVLLCQAIAFFTLRRRHRGLRHDYASRCSENRGLKETLKLRDAELEQLRSSPRIAAVEMEGDRRRVEYVAPEGKP